MDQKIGDTQDPEPKKDAFKLSDEEFQKELENATEGDTGDPGPANEPLAGGDTGPPSTPKPETKPEPFTLETPDPDPDPSLQQGDPDPGSEMIELIHNGQVHKVTREKAIQLAQKGFDYDVKVGPHQRIAQILETDRGAGQVLNDYLTGRLQVPAAETSPVVPDKPAAPELKALSEYDSENEWLRDNVAAIQKATPAPAPAPAPQTPQYNPVDGIANTLAARDPEGYGRVSPVLDEFARKNLTMEQYTQVNSGDMASLTRFYDWVRPQVMGQPSANPQGFAGAPPGPVTPKGNPQFRVRSQGGAPPRETDSQRVWELPNDQFQAIISKAKGY